MKTIKKRTVHKIILLILLLLPSILFIPIYFNTPLISGTREFIKYLSFIQIYWFFSYLFLLVMWIDKLLYSKKSKIKFKELLINYSILIWIPLLFFLLFGLYYEKSIDILGMIIFWVYPVGWLELSNMFGLGWVLFYISGIGWGIVLFMKYIYAYLILRIFKFPHKYMYYIVSFIVALISTVTWIIMLQVFLYAT